MNKFIISLITIILFISCKKAPLETVRIEAENIPVTNEIISESAIDSFLKPYKAHIEKEMNTILSYTPVNLTRTDGNLESSLGNLMADLSYELANPIFKKRTGNTIDFVLFNYGGIRAGIDKGNITNAHAFKLMPFENTFVVAELSREKLEELISFLIDKKLAHPLSRQVQLTVLKNGFDLKINNIDYKKKDSYFILTSDYLQNGGDDMTFFKNPLTLHKLDYKVRNAIIDYFKKTDTIKVALDGRFKLES